MSADNTHTSSVYSNTSELAFSSKEDESNNKNKNHEDSNDNLMHHVMSISGVTEFGKEAERELGLLAAKNNDNKLVAVVEKTATTSTKPEDEEVLFNCCSKTAGARVLFATDEWFATADHLLDDDDSSDGEPQFDPDAYCAQGKVMDGWETRRKRMAGHDWCILRLSAPIQQVHSMEIDTAYFTGNHVPRISLEMAHLTPSQEVEMVTGLPGGVERLLRKGGEGIQGQGCTPDQVAAAEQAASAQQWQELLPPTPLQPGYEATRLHKFVVEKAGVTGAATHIRVNYFPDGGVARLRVFGTAAASHEENKPSLPPVYSPISTGPRCTVVSHTTAVGDEEVLPSQRMDETLYPQVSCEDQGGVGVTCSNHHYGEPSHLVRRNYGVDMGDGWETARHPDRPGILVKKPESGLIDTDLSDWCVLKLGRVVTEIEAIILDTKWFRGNFPESVMVEGCYCDNDNNIDNEDDDNDSKWFPLIPRGRMAPDSEHWFEQHQLFLNSTKMMISHIRVSIFPDGGLSRVRVYAAK